jgi:hypothetical protein
VDSIRVTPGTDRARRARELHEALNAAFPADNHDTIDDQMRVMMLALSQEDALAQAQAPGASYAQAAPNAPAGLWRRLVSILSGRRPA